MGICSKECPQQFFGPLGFERIEAELSGVRLAPSGPVFGAVGEEEQDADIRQAVDQPPNGGLSLGVDPVKILEHEAERLHLTLPDQQPLDRVQRLLSALEWLE